MIRVMTRLVIHFAAIAVGSQLALAADVPQFDARPSCQAAAAAAVMAGRTSENCLEDERSARSKLDAAWAAFSPADKRHCLALLRAGGGPSYVELLSCLEMSRDARLIAERRAKRQADDTPPAGAETTGSGAAAAPRR